MISGLQFLCELYSLGQLKTIVADLFNILLGSTRLNCITVCELLWKGDSYRNSLQNYGSVRLTELLQTYPLRQHLTCSVRKRWSFDGNILLFPLELTEMILMKAVGQLFADVYTVMTFCCVSSIWHQLLTRHYNNYFRHVCHPFKCSPVKVTPLIEGDYPVWGVAVSDDELYVAQIQSNEILVFSNRPPFARLENITVPDLEIPQDIVICNDTGHLYIADGGGTCAIWRVNLSHNEEVDKFVTIKKRPFSLSVKSLHLLITPGDGDALFAYGEDGNQLSHTTISDHMWARHAVETSRKTYIVSHRGRSFDIRRQLNYSGVSELDVDGRVVCTFGSGHADIGAVQFNMPYYMALHGDGHLIVADYFNKCIVVLKSDLDVKLVLLSSLEEQPLRLCLSRDNCRNITYLFVAHAVSPIISVFELQ